MREHHRGISVVRVQHFEARGRRPDPFEQRPDHGDVDARRWRGAESDRLIAEEIRLAPEPEVHRAQLREPTHLREDAGHFAEFRLAVHRLDAEGAPFVDVPHTALRGVELDRERLRRYLPGTIGPEIRTRRSPASGWPARTRSIVTYSHSWPASRTAPATYRG